MPAVATKVEAKQKPVEKQLDKVGTEQTSQDKHGVDSTSIKNGATGAVLARDPQTGRIVGGGEIDTEGMAGSTDDLKQALDAAEQVGKEVFEHFGPALKATRDAKTGMFLKGAVQPGAVVQARQAAKHRTVIMASVTTSDVQEVLLALMMKAKQGNLPAIVEFFNRVIGKPLEADVLERLASLEDIARQAANGQIGQGNQAGIVATTPVGQGQAALASGSQESTPTS